MFNKFRKVFILGVGIMIFGLFQSVNADWFEDSKGGISAGQPQDIVISLQSNPMSDPERACLAVTFARSLSTDSTSKTNNVTLFVTLDGVSLADDSVVSSRRFKCDIPASFKQGEVISLQDNLKAFLAGNNDNMVVCPICWNKRNKSEVPGIPVSPDYGVLPSKDTQSVKDALGDHWAPGTAIGKMMLDADKILDF